MTVTTIGSDIDTDGYSITASGQTVSVASSGTATFQLAPGSFQVRLAGVAANCFLTTSDSATADVVLSSTTRVEFTSDCFAKSERLLFSGGGNIVILDPFQNSRSVIRLPLTFVTDPTWTARGTNILFEGTNRPLPPAFEGRGFTIPNLDLYQVNLDGTGLINLTNSPSSAYDTDASTSPDGSRIVFSGLRYGTTRVQATELWTMNSDGSNQRAITQTSARDESTPAWAPDGNSIAYTAIEQGAVRISLILPDGSNNRTLSIQGLAYHSQPAWSPNGNMLAFVGGPTGPADTRIYLSNADGSNPQPIQQTRRGDFNPGWSRNGRWILFTRRVDGNPFTDLFMASIAGTAVVRLTLDGAAPGSWKP